MSAGPAIRRLGPDDAPAVVTLRREALDREPFAFGASPLEDSMLSADHVRALLTSPDPHAMFGHFSGTDLTGMVGLRREPGAKRRHRASVQGMYVTPRARRQGVARALLAAVVDEARRWPGVEQVHLGVSGIAAEAQRVYEAAGFHEWGRAPRAIRWEGRYADMLHLMLDLGSRREGETR